MEKWGTSIRFFLKLDLIAEKFGNISMLRELLEDFKFCGEEEFVLGCPGTIEEEFLHCTRLQGVQVATQLDGAKVKSVSTGKEKEEEEGTEPKRHKTFSLERQSKMLLAIKRKGNKRATARQGKKRASKSRATQAKEEVRSARSNGEQGS